MSPPSQSAPVQHPSLLAALPRPRTPPSFLLFVLLFRWRLPSSVHASRALPMIPMRLSPRFSQSPLIRLAPRPFTRFLHCPPAYLSVISCDLTVSLIFCIFSTLFLLRACFALTPTCNVYPIILCDTCVSASCCNASFPFLVFDFALFRVYFLFFHLSFFFALIIFIIFRFHSA